MTHILAPIAVRMLWHCRKCAVEWNSIREEGCWFCGGEPERGHYTVGGRPWAWFSPTVHPEGVLNL